MMPTIKYENDLICMTIKNTFFIVFNISSSRSFYFDYEYRFRKHDCINIT